MLGHGSSSSSEADDYTVESHAGSSSELLEVLELTYLPVTLICHSAGGAVGLALAKLLLNRLTGFINLEGNLIGEDCGLATRWTSTMSFTDFLERGRNTLAEKIASQGEDTSYFMATDPKAFYKMAHSVVSWSDSGHLLSTFLFELSCSRLYVYGEKNWDMPILSRLAPVPAVAIPCSGHVMMVDNPNIFYQTIGQFIRENPAIHA
jgi:pimeloyl-ACP methyl ester carboxylesterase